MKKAQITMFIIIGILLIAAFGFVLYTRGQKAESKTEPEIEKITEAIARDTSIRYYVISCLDSVSKDALKLAGRQSGYIYDFQARGTYPYRIFYQPPAKDYGAHIIPFDYEGEKFLVAYGIYAPILVEASLTNRPPPWYPYPGSLVARPICLNCLGNYLPGDPRRTSSLPTLCYTNSSNYYNLSGFQWSCEKPYSNLASLAVQYWLEIYISNKTRECVNLSFIKLKGYNITEGGGINTSVLFGEDSVVVTIRYPLTISMSGKQPFTQLLSFTSEQPVRLKKIYELANHIIKENVRNIFFDFSNETLKHFPNDCLLFNVSSSTRSITNTTCLYPGMNVSQYRDVCNNNNDYLRCKYSDIIVIKDYDSLVDNKPYVFAFAIENRIPAIDFIDESVNSSYNYYSYLNNTYKVNLTKLYRNISSTPNDDNYNMVAEVGGRLEIIPMAIDPEGDRLAYNYSGWKTPIKIYNITGGEYEYEVTFSGYSSPTLFKGENVSGGKGDCSWWHDSNYYQFVVAYEKDKRKDADYPDPSLKTTGCSPSLPQLQYSDVGYHWVRINVSDNAGLRDWQDIKIQVRCKPDDNKCCDTAADYHYKPNGTYCGKCMRCDATGNCVFDSGHLNQISKEDCPVCYKCNQKPNGEGECTKDIDKDDTSGKCNLQYPGHGVCCGGTCKDKNKLGPWVSNLKLCAQCYEDAQCVGSEWKFLPKTTGISCGDGSYSCINGKCVDNTGQCYIIASHSICIDKPASCS
jgi:hypothetical protein